MISISKVGIWALLIVVPTTAGASVIFTNLGAAPGYDTTTGNFVGNGQDASGFNYAQASTFVVGSTATLAGLRLGLSCFVSDSCNDTVNVSLLADSGADTPGSLIETFTFAGSSLGIFGNSNPLINFTSILGPTLTASSQYWVAVSTASTSSVVWNLNNTGDASDQGISTDGGGTWFVPSGQTPSAYQVDATTSSVPEPSTFALLIGGVALLGFARRHGQKTSA